MQRTHRTKGSESAHRETRSASSSIGARQNASYLLIAWFPIFVAFVLIPFAVFIPNQTDFSDNFFGPSVGIITAVIAFLLLLPVLLLQPRVRARVSVLLFFFGIYLVLADVFAPLQIGALTSGPSQITPWSPPFFTIVELVLLGVCLWTGIRIPTRWATTIGVPFVIVLVASQALYFAANIGSNIVVKGGGYTFYEKKTRPFITENPAPTGNVYQLCFDQYSSLVFLDAVKKLDAFDAFEGFTFFKNTRSNYVFTCGSLPSYFTGTYFPGGSIMSWEDQRTNSGMIKTLHDHGYFASMYVPNSGYFHSYGS
ncbi:MAG: hypothetical protein RDU20_12565, partial [Desulfomonilaceae bacterium]|nr:hypothetical protein [Desulfomonilaceae bacterium]